MITRTTSLVKNQIWDLFSTSHEQKRSRNKKHTSALESLPTFPSTRQYRLHCASLASGSIADLLPPSSGSILRTKGGEVKERPARRIDTAVKSCRRNALHLHSGFFLSEYCRSRREENRNAIKWY
ncbi:hypothetical protein HN51_048479 [Arachis hypogaea]